jgi:hypothetical protein
MLGQTVVETWQRVGSLEWSAELTNPRWADTDLKTIPTGTGVYAWLTGNEVQKFGKAEGERGLRQRHHFGRGRLDDSTTALWHRVWGEGTLQGARIDVFFFPLPAMSVTVAVPGVGPMTVPAHTARGLEYLLSAMARGEGNPMLLAGRAD